jgi:hypothetical protein
MFVKDIKIVILLDNGHHHDAEEEKEKKKGFSTNLLLRALVHQNLDHCIRFILRKVEIHTLSNDLRRNL